MLAAFFGPGPRDEWTVRQARLTSAITCVYGGDLATLDECVGHGLAELGW